MVPCACLIPVAACSLLTLREEAQTEETAHIPADGTIRCMPWRKKREKEHISLLKKMVITPQFSRPRIYA